MVAEIQSFAPAMPVITKRGLGSYSGQECEFQSKANINSLNKQRLTSLFIFFVAIKSTLELSPKSNLSNKYTPIDLEEMTVICNNQTIINH